MKNKTIKKLTKGIVAIALTIATVVGAGVIGAQEYNAYTKGIKNEDAVNRAIMRWFQAGVCSMSMPASWANCMVTQPLWRITSRSFLLILCVRLCGR